MIAITDPRPLYTEALTWAAGLVAAVAPEQFDAPTPCAEFDVRGLVSHLAGTVVRAREIGRGQPHHPGLAVVTGVPDDGWAAALADAVADMQAVWAEDALLDRDVAVPWGAMPARAALVGYLNEALVHGWDLAVATDQEVEAPPALASAVLAAMQAAIPADGRAGTPFNAVVEPAPDAGPTERLANWSGHRRP